MKHAFLICKVNGRLTKTLQDFRSSPKGLQANPTDGALPLKTGSHKPGILNAPAGRGPTGTPVAPAAISRRPSDRGNRTPNQGAGIGIVGRRRTLWGISVKWSGPIHGCPARNTLLKTLHVLRLCDSHVVETTLA